MQCHAKSTSTIRVVLFVTSAVRGPGMEQLGCRPSETCCLGGLVTWCGLTTGPRHVCCFPRSVVEEERHTITEGGVDNNIMRLGRESGTRSGETPRVVRPPHRAYLSQTPTCRRNVCMYVCMFILCLSLSKPPLCFSCSGVVKRMRSTACSADVMDEHVSAEHIRFFMPGRIHTEAETCVLRKSSLFSLGRPLHKRS